jgi:CubicO group peptidase (beta-lactamase class C family)
VPIRSRPIAVLVVSLWVLSLLASCASEAAEAPPDAPISSTTEATTSTTSVPVDEPGWPEDEWEVVDPEVAGVDPAVLETLAARAEAAGSDCFVVTRNGRVVGEWYWNGTDADSEREAFSVMKSITSTLVGIAQAQGYLDIDQPASDFIDEWRGTPSEAVTIRNLLSNDSGRFQTAQSDYVQMATLEADKTAYAIGLDQEHDVGTFWVYNNAAIQVLEAVLERATGTDVNAFAAEHLFTPLGMTTSISTDQAGNTLTFMGAQMSCLDMARFGLLHLRGGDWNGTQVVPAEWVAEATSPSTDLNPGYGFLWWLFGENGVETETAPGQPSLTPGSDGYAALGLGGQVIAVIPDHDLVVTRLGAPGAGQFGLYNMLAELRSELVTN